MSGLFGSFTFNQSDDGHRSTPADAGHGRPRQEPTLEGQTEADQRPVAGQTLAPLATGESKARPFGKEEKSSYESEAEFYSPATGLPERAVGEDVAKVVSRSVDLDQPSTYMRRSDEHSPTSASKRRISGYGLEEKQDSFITAEEIKLPMRPVATADSSKTYSPYSEQLSIDPLSKDSDPSAEATPTSRSPRLKPRDNSRHVDAKTDNINAHHRIRSSQASQYLPFSAVASADIHSESYHDTGSLGSGSRTAGNSPSISPPQFKGGPSPLNGSHATRNVDLGIYSSPNIHHARRESPKETHIADVDVDPISGRKLINQYEIIDELGRGVHGKVKLGRNLNTDEFVAIKIVDRSARRRRLGKISNPAEKIKREIAILKKARHPNIVSLLEVIDDPAKKKVYIVLEHVEMGEIIWRTEGDRDICRFEYHHTQHELKSMASNDKLANPEAVQNINIENTSNDPYKWESESGPTRGHSSFSELSYGGRQFSHSENCFDHHHRENTSSPQNLDLNDNPQRLSSVSEERRFEKYVANNGTKIDSLLRNAASEGSHKNDQVTHKSPQHTQHMRSSSRIFDTNATISAVDHYHLPVSTDRDVPEYFQHVPTMSLPAIREAFRDTVLGLEYLHYQGVIHRDIKPANLLQTREHRVKISDFGVSFLGRQLRENENDDTTESEAQDFDEGVELAKTVGTPAFFAPELCQTDFDVEPPPVTGQIDVWALGVTLYCLVYGRVPYFHLDTFVLMRMIAHDEVHIPRKRLKAIDEINFARQSISNDESAVGLAQPFSPESIHEDVDDDLHDLIQRLLIKDSRKRITLAEVKRHPWILKDVGDPALWVDETDPSHQTQGKKIEVSKEDVADAVVPLNIIERVKNEFRRIGGALGLGRSSSRRKRADSSSVATDQASFNPDIGVSAKGTSRRPTEATVTITHVGSSAAGKSDNSSAQGFSGNIRDRTKREDVKRKDYFGPAKAPPRPSITEQAHDRRISMPAFPNRQRSTINSVRLPPLSDSVTHDGVASFPTHTESFNLSGLPVGNAARTNVMGEPGRRFLRSVRSRERRSQSRLREGNEHKRSKQDLQDQSEHQRAEPSVAFSTAHAEGHVDVMPARRKGSFAADSAHGTASPKRLSFNLTEQISSASGNLSVSRKSSGSSPLSPQKSAEFASSGSPRQRNCFGHSIRRKLSGDKYQQAQDEVIRRMVLEDARFNEAHTTASRQRKQWSDANYVAYPPSPDDNSYGVDHDQTFDQPREQMSSPSSYASRWHIQYITPSSSDDHFTSGFSQSTSNPSIPSVASASSSIIPEEDNKYEPKPANIRRSSGDTVKTKPKLVKSRYSKNHAATGTGLVETDADYHEDADADNDNDNNDDPDDDDDDEDDFIQMSRRKTMIQEHQLGNVYRSKSTAYQRPARRRFPRRSIDDGS